MKDEFVIHHQRTERDKHPCYFDCHREGNFPVPTLNMYVCSLCRRELEDARIAIRVDTRTALPQLQVTSSRQAPKLLTRCLEMAGFTVTPWKEVDMRGKHGYGAYVQNSNGQDLEQVIRDRISESALEIDVDHFG